VTIHLAVEHLRATGWKDCSVLQLRGGHSPLWLFFEPGQTAPGAVGKFSSVPDVSAKLRRECEALDALRPVARELGIPLMLYRTESEKGLLSLQTGLPGKPMADELSPSDSGRLGAQFRLVEPWIERFQRLAPATGTAGAALHELLLSLPSGTPAEAVAAAAAALPVLSRIQAVAVHGDFWARNVLVAPRRTSVVDWEGFHLGDPLEDIFSFAAGSVFRCCSDVERSVDLLWNVFFGRTPLTALARSACFRALARFNLSSDLLRPCFLSYVLGRLSRSHFTDNSAMRAFVLRYVDKGMPEPWCVKN
jgi:hypothetical protein